MGWGEVPPCFFMSLFCLFCEVRVSCVRAVVVSLSMLPCDHGSSAANSCTVSQASAPPTLVAGNARYRGSHNTLMTDERPREQIRSHPVRRRTRLTRTSESSRIICWRRSYRGQSYRRNSCLIPRHMTECKARAKEQGSPKVAHGQMKPRTFPPRPLLAHSSPGCLPSDCGFL